MNSLLVLCVVVFAGSSPLCDAQRYYTRNSVALPYRQGQDSTQQIEERSFDWDPVIEFLSKLIRGKISELPDPYQVPDAEAVCEVGNLTYRASAKGISFGGLSKIAITNLYIISSTSIRVDTVNALNVLNIGSIDVDFNFMGINVPVRARGQVAITDTRAQTTVDAQVFPPHVKSVQSRVAIGTLASHLDASVAGVDVSATVNHIVNDIVPKILGHLGDQIDATVSKIIFNTLSSIQ